MAATTSSATPCCFNAIISWALGLYGICEFLINSLMTEGSTLASTIFKMSATPADCMEPEDADCTLTVVGFATGGSPTARPVSSDTTQETAIKRPIRFVTQLFMVTSSAKPFRHSTMTHSADLSRAICCPILAQAHFDTA